MCEGNSPLHCLLPIHLVMGMGRVRHLVGFRIARSPQWGSAIATLVPAHQLGSRRFSQHRHPLTASIHPPTHPPIAHSSMFHLRYTRVGCQTHTHTAFAKLCFQFLAISLFFFGGGKKHSRFLSLSPLLPRLSPFPLPSALFLSVPRLGGMSKCSSHRQRGDLNPCGQSPMDFESITLTTRSHCPGRM